MRLLVFVRALQEICRDDGSPKGKMRLPTQDKKGEKERVFRGRQGRKRGSQGQVVRCAAIVNGTKVGKSD